jgi:hypothetical protein
MIGSMHADLTEKITAETEGRVSLLTQGTAADIHASEVKLSALNLDFEKLIALNRQSWPSCLR